MNSTQSIQLNNTQLEPAQNSGTKPPINAIEHNPVAQHDVRQRQPSEFSQSSHGHILPCVTLKYHPPSPPHEAVFAFGLAPQLKLFSEYGCTRVIVAYYVMCTMS